MKKLTTFFDETCRENQGIEDGDRERVWQFAEGDADAALVALGVRHLALPQPASDRRVTLKCVKCRRPFGWELEISFERYKSDPPVPGWFSRTKRQADWTHVVTAPVTIMASHPVEPLPVRCVRRAGICGWSVWQKLVDGEWIDTSMTGAKKVLRDAGYRGLDIDRAAGWCILNSTR